MSWSTEYEELMPHTITVEAVSGFSTDGYLTATYAAASTFQARVAQRQTLVRTFAGTEEMASTVAWVASTTTFSASDRITLPDASTPPLLRAEMYPDEDGGHHAKLYFGG